MIQKKKLSREEVEILRRKTPGTNGKSVSLSEGEVLDMKEHLQTLYAGGVTMAFAEKIALREKSYMVGQAESL